jgi:hypothetical protein
MIRLAAYVVTVYLSAGLVDASAQQNVPPPVFGDTHQSEFGNFSHWSAVFPKDSSRFEIEYAVCNFDNGRALIYKWDGPNIGVGEGGTLPKGKCHILRRDVAAFEADRNAFIAFTQAARQHPAPAYLSKLFRPEVTSLLPRLIVNALRTYYGPEGVAAQPSLANLVITQARTDGEIQHTISWHPPTVMVAIGIPAFGGAEANTVVTNIKEAGYNANVSNLRAVLDESNWQAISQDRLAQQVILLTKTEKSPPALQLKLLTKTQAMSSSNVTVIDTTSKKLVTDVEISTFVP